MGNYLQNLEDTVMKDQHWKTWMYKNVEKSMTEVTVKYGKEQFTYKTVQHHACVNEMLAYF